MLDGELFDKLEYIARKIRNNPRPFGGLQLVLLVKVYRQKDTELIELLNELRFGQLSEKSQIILKKIEVEPNYPSDGIQPTQLVATNSEAKKINSAENLELKKGAQVMLIKNLTDKLVNGCQGVIIGFRNVKGKDLPLVRFVNGIDKVIGQTIERLKIDLGRVFEKGQAYVALSRACSLDSLQVKGFTKNKIFVDEKFVRADNGLTQEKLKAE
ncbi:11660_t:CDS:2 [Entrophospora sp. SA101]|nr:11660_t:CDS:2 [Entrophospora sp. SA101]